MARISSYSYSCTFTKQPGPYVLTFDYDSSTMRTFVDGVQADTFSTGESIKWGSTAIGRSGTGSSANYWAGAIAEIMIFDDVLSDAERETIEEQLHDKWFGPLAPELISAVHFTAVKDLREGTANVEAGASVGTLSATDGIGSITYSLTEGEGDTDNDRFTIEGDQVKVGSEPLTEGTYSFRVEAVDSEANAVQDSFTIYVLDENEPSVVVVNNPYADVNWDTVNQQKQIFIPILRKVTGVRLLQRN